MRSDQSSLGFRVDWMIVTKDICRQRFVTSLLTDCCKSSDRLLQSFDRLLQVFWQIVASFLSLVVAILLFLILLSTICWLSQLAVDSPSCILRNPVVDSAIANITTKSSLEKLKQSLFIHKNIPRNSLVSLQSD